AIALDKPGLPFRRLYRSVLIIPYAVPAFLSLLVWQGLLNDDFGAVNHILHAHIPWLLGSAWWARVSVIFVSMWLTFPYFFLVSMGALQSIPTELTEAARVDGGGPWQVFRKVEMPLRPGRAAARDDAAPARRRRAASDRVLRVQLQQLQQHLPAHRRRPGGERPVDRGR